MVIIQLPRIVLVLIALVVNLFDSKAESKVIALMGGVLLLHIAELFI